jgi:hypothetical protein
MGESSLFFPPSFSTFFTSLPCFLTDLFAAYLLLYLPFLVCSFSNSLQTQFHSHRQLAPDHQQQCCTQGGNRPGPEYVRPVTVL